MQEVENKRKNISDSSGPSQARRKLRKNMKEQQEKEEDKGIGKKDEDEEKRHLVLHT